MCGIAGFVGEGGEDVLRRMTIALKHRGPDDQGTFLESGIGLAHTRLAIIDLSPGGHQPMESATGKSVIVFNGEIYNFRELREELRSSAYQFKSHSDTEVILALYEREGPAGFSKLNGMFALALYDREKQQVVLARDKMGKKPLYWGVCGGTLLFGSELRALRCHPKWRGELDPLSLQQYFACDYVPTPRSIFKDIYKLEPATALVWQSGAVVETHTFWRPPTDQSTLSLADATEQLDVLLAKSVQRRLVADVPLGVFLSGGLDSSTIAYYAQQASAIPIKTFSIGFSDMSFDESAQARLVARVLGTEHHEEIFSPTRCIDCIPAVATLMDEPLADPSILPTYLLSGFTRTQVTVALGGDGADELFAGYPTFQAEKVLKIYQHLPQTLRHQILEPFIQQLPMRTTYMSVDFKLKKFLEGAERSQHTRHQHWLGSFTDEEQTLLLTAPFSSNPYAFLDQYFDAFPNQSFERQLLYVYLRTYLMDEVMVKVDRASMMHALEARSPFLDYTVVDFVTQLPYQFKMHGLTTKFILKHLMQERLPSTTVYKRKQGFAIPLASWLRGPLKSLCHDLLSKNGLYKTGLFSSIYIERLKSEHEAGTHNHSKKLWSLITFALWYDSWHANI